MNPGTSEPRNPGTSPIKRAGLVARHALPSATAALAEAAAWLQAHGCTPVVDEDSAAAGKLTTWRTAPRRELSQQVDVVIAFGGDGTLLEVASTIAHSPVDVPVLGVNLGHLGFLTEVSRSELVDALQALVDGQTWTETRAMLDGRIESADDSTDRLALNDIVITRGSLSRMIELDVTVDGQFVSHVKADGLIIATATGSTAYNLSAGGPILLPSVDAFVLTPIAPHALTNRPVVLPATAEIVVRPAGGAAGRSDIVTFDGQHGLPIRDGDSLLVRRSARVLTLIHTSSRSHFDMLREKLKWGNG
jgi:NAD+ kinase